MAERKRVQAKIPRQAAPAPAPINPGFFEADPGRVASGLLGKVMQVGQVEALILDADGYRRAENEKDGLYRPLLTLPPGSIYCPRRRNSLLLLIATHDRGERGGCALVRACEVDGAVYDGPGRLTERLGISIHGTAGHVEWQSDAVFTAVMDTPLTPVEPSKQERSTIRREGNGIGEATLERYFPQLAKIYITQKPNKRFEEFVNDILAECADVGALRRKLTAMRK